MHAICDAIDEALSREGIKLNRREGKEDSGWVLLDFGYIIVHVLSTLQREYYDIESLWKQATQVVRIL
jgi:ribosome-associated protein